MLNRPVSLSTHIICFGSDITTFFFNYALLYLEVWLYAIFLSIISLEEIKKQLGKNYIYFPVLGRVAQSESVWLQMRV